MVESSLSSTAPSSQPCPEIGHDHDGHHVMCHVCIPLHNSTFETLNSSEEWKALLSRAAVRNSQSLSAQNAEDCFDGVECDNCNDYGQGNHGGHDQAHDQAHESVDEHSDQVEIGRIGKVRMLENEQRIQQSSILILQSHSDGVMWRGLVPLLTTTGGKNDNTAHSVEKERLSSGHLGHYGTKKMRRNHIRTKSAMPSLVPASLALSVLFRHFYNYIGRIAVHSTSEKFHDQSFDGLSMQPKNNSSSGACRTDSTINHARSEDDRINNSNAIILASSHIIGQWLMASIPMVSSLHGHDSKSNKTTIPAHFFLLLLPPNPQYQPHHPNYCFHYSRTPPTNPLSSFSRRLLRLENNQIRLTSLSAYVSTLGGGAFLCRYLSSAVSLARQQCHIALLRGDEGMAWKCRINEGYCYIYAGRLKRGRRVVRRVLKEVLESLEKKNGSGGEERLRLVYHGGVKNNDHGKGDNENDFGVANLSLLPAASESGRSAHHKSDLCELTIIKNMCLSALWFTNRVEEAGLSDHGAAASHDEKNGKKGGAVNGSNGSSGAKLSATHDDFQRIRIVRDRTWN